MNRAPRREAQRTGRLQRAPDARGYRVDTFADVVKRHGVTMTLVAFSCLLFPGASALIATTTGPFMLAPENYAAAAVCLLAFFFVWSARRSDNVQRESLWLLYLLWISVVEELAFRLLLPALMDNQLPRLYANVASNALFAGIHYFTLRWRLRNCIATFLGGMGLSHLMGQGDLVLVIMVHWAGTFLNTPWPPPVRESKY